MISVIIPVYNGEEYIAETVGHILHGKYQDVEVIVVIDGTHDKSQDICEAIAERDDRVKVYYKENGGIASARNYGIARAHGEYIGVCDQDDVVQAEMYTSMVSVLDAENADFAFCSTGQLVDGQIIPFETFDDAVYVGKDILEQLLYPVLFEGYQVPVARSNVNRPPSIWKALIRKEFWDCYKLHFHAYVSFEDDLLMTVQILSLATKVCTVSYRGYLWRINMQSESHARKYIDDIGKKQELWCRDICQYVDGAKIPQDVKNMIKSVTNCKQYVDAILNLCSSQRKESFHDIKMYYENNIYKRDFEESIKMAEYAQAQYPMQKYILMMLKKKHTYGSYWMAQILSFILYKVLKSKVFMKLDSMLKHK